MKLPSPRQLPSGNWRIQIVIGGQRHSITKDTPEKCTAETERLVVLYEEGLKPSRIVSKRLGDVVDNYIDSRSNVLSPSTLRAYRAYRTTRFQAYMPRPAGQIDYQRMINDEARLCSPKSIKNAWGLVRASLADVGITPTVRLPAPKPHEKEWLTPEQIKVFVKAVHGQPVEIGALLALSGLRRSEIYGLEWKDIDLENRVIHVHQSKVLGEDAKAVVRKQNKNMSSTRDVPIFLPALYDALCAVPDKSGYVMTCNIGTLRKWLKRACGECGLPDIGVHGLRHSFCSLCYSIGISELACMRLGGWSDFQTMRKIYTHLSEADQKASSDKLSAFFDAHEMHTAET